MTGSTRLQGELVGAKVYIYPLGGNAWPHDLVMQVPGPQRDFDLPVARAGATAHETGIGQGQIGLMKKGEIPY